LTKQEKLSTFIWFALAIAYVLGFQYLEVGGYEWFLFREATLSNGFAPRVANPPYTFSLLYPIALLPVRWGIFVYSFVAVFFVYLTHRLTKVNKWFLLFSYPTIRNLFFAQLDILSMLGVALGWWSIQRKKPVWLGVAVTLLGIKPQVTGVLGFIYAVWGWHVKVLFFPTAVLLYSFLFYGFWIPEWIQHILSQSTGSDPFFQGGIGAFPWGLLAWLFLILGYRYYDKTQFAAAVIAATILSAPYVGFYSVMAFFGLPTLWYTYLLALPLHFLIDMRLILIAIIIYPLLQYSWQVTTNPSKGSN
jgi:hypothetical protein